jgi:protein SCO1
MIKGGLFRIVSFVLVFLIGILTAYHYLKPDERLKIYKPSGLNPKLVNAAILDRNGEHTIAPFSLFNQDGQLLNDSLLSGKIYVADFFFTTCPTICPIMTKQMKRVYNQYHGHSNFSILSHTVTPEFDSVKVLKDYANQNGINDAATWHFLTGSKKQIYELARNSYFATTSIGDGDEDDFIHTENFILIDTKKRIRGFYDGTNTKEVDRLLKDIEVLFKENK